MYLKNNFVDGQQLTKRKLQNLENGCRKLMGQEFNNEYFYAHGVKELVTKGTYWQSKNWLNAGGGTVTQLSYGASLLKIFTIGDGCSLVFGTAKDFTKNNSEITFSDGQDLYLCISSTTSAESYAAMDDNTIIRIKIHYDNFGTETNYSYYDLKRYEIVNTIVFGSYKQTHIKISDFTDVGTKSMQNVKGLSIAGLVYIPAQIDFYILVSQIQKESIINSGYCTPYFEINGDSYIEKYGAFSGCLLTKILGNDVLNYSLKFYKRLNFLNKYDFVVYAKSIVAEENEIRYQAIGIESRLNNNSLNWSFYISKSSNTDYYTFRLVNEKSIAIASKQTSIQTLVNQDILHFWLFKEGNNITGIMQCERLVNYHSFCCEFAELSNVVDIYYGNPSTINNNICNTVLKEFQIYGI